MERQVGVGFAFDKIMDVFEEDIEASATLETELIPVSHIKRIVGLITHDMAEDKGELEFLFYRDENAIQLVGTLAGYLDVGQHTVDVIPFADFLKIKITNTDTGTKTVTSAIAGHYGPFKD